MAVHKEVEALRDGEQAAREREQARQEMEATLLQQEIDSEQVNIAEQSTTGRDRSDGTDTVFVGGVGQNSDTGEQVDESAADDAGPHRMHPRGERLFAGDGRHPLDEQ